MRTELPNSMYRLDARGLPEALQLVGLDWKKGALFQNKKSRIRYFVSSWDDLTGKVHLLQDTGRRGGSGSRMVTPHRLAHHYEQVVR